MSGVWFISKNCFDALNIEDQKMLRMIHTYVFYFGQLMSLSRMKCSWDLKPMLDSNYM